MPSKTSISTARSPSPDPVIVNESPAVEELFLARTAEFAFHRQRLSFDLARTVFASAGVDPGSALLLRYLQTIGLRGGERVLDVGAGHGTLGVVLAALDRGRSVTFVDRDALACMFTRRNLENNELLTPADGHPAPVVRGSLGYDAVASEQPFDLVVSNIPGKAGEDVIAHLINGAADVARPGAIVGFVVVEPLAAVLEAHLSAPRFEPLLTKGNKTHHVSIGRVVQGRGDVAARQPIGSVFDEGLYDRQTTTFTSGQLDWTATTVTGLDEFDNLAQSTRLLRAALEGVRSAPSVVAHPGQGHRAVIAALAGYRPEVLVARDLLALTASQRLLVQNGFGQERALIHGLSVPAEWFDRARLLLLHADDKVHGPWFTAEVVRYLDHVDASPDRARRDLVLTGRSGLLGRLEADVLRRRKGHVAFKKSVKGYRALRYVSGR